MNISNLPFSLFSFAHQETTSTKKGPMMRLKFSYSKDI